MCVPEWVGTPTNGTPYTNPAGLKCKYTGTGPGAPGTNYYYLCCPAGGGGTTTTTTTPPPAAACTVRIYSIQCAGAGQNYSCQNARQNCALQPGYMSANDDGNNANRHIDCTVCQ